MVISGHVYVSTVYRTSTCHQGAGWPIPLWQCHLSAQLRALRTRRTVRRFISNEAESTLTSNGTRQARHDDKRHDACRQCREHRGRFVFPHGCCPHPHGCCPHPLSGCPFLSPRPNFVPLHPPSTPSSISRVRHQYSLSSGLCGLQLEHYRFSGRVRKRSSGLPCLCRGTTRDTQQRYTVDELSQTLWKERGSVSPHETSLVILAVVTLAESLHHTTSRLHRFPAHSGTYNGPAATAQAENWRIEPCVINHNRPARYSHVV